MAGDWSESKGKERHEGRPSTRGEEVTNRRNIAWGGGKGNKTGALDNI
jgi:hypothetical protein